MQDINRQEVQDINRDKRCRISTETRGAGYQQRQEVQDINRGKRCRILTETRGAGY